MQTQPLHSSFHGAYSEITRSMLYTSSDLNQSIPVIQSLLDLNYDQLFFPRCNLNLSSDSGTRAKDQSDHLVAGSSEVSLRRAGVHNEAVIFGKEND
ncbi:hypothetical protein LOAG_00311 [Loa loa]|uniref:Uncharacterized protein n=1 Tax=Loa loa TaxID=7209 RepID=A0A1S0UBF7_LOALO|nr:hypothetical protein LOAG_00311 [Loa loa]EFO28178.1 hypothetical protein LOAG_00311 [Loa loa]